MFGEGEMSDLGECRALRQAFWVPIGQLCVTTLRNWDILESGIDFSNAWDITIYNIYIYTYPRVYVCNYMYETK